MVDPKTKEFIIKIVEMFHPDAKIYLFGSYARGTMRQGSDIDIAVDIGRKMTIREIQDPWRLIDALSIPQTVDIVDMHRIPETMKQVILKEGIVWKS